MVAFMKKELCCGCSACVQSCPKQCIKMLEDNEGFLYPTINTSECVNCGLCEKVCPMKKHMDTHLPLIVYAAKNQNELIRSKSSSGGVFTALAEWVIDKDGVVFGARFNNKWDVIHDYTETKEGLAPFRGSKYVQSDIGSSYKKAKEFLGKGRLVLFCGTPCQIAGLKQFLKKDYTNLFCVDFICHGVPSPGIFRWYLQDTIDQYAIENRIKGNSSQIQSIPNDALQLPQGVEIRDIQFRDKREGWKKYTFVVTLINHSKGSKPFEIAGNTSNNLFLGGFVRDLYLRPSCHNCPSRGFKSGSDITIGDFWGQEIIFPQFDRDTGVSAVLIKTKKGETLFDSIGNLSKTVRELKEVLTFNPSLVHSNKAPYYRYKFWRLPFKYSFEQRINKTLNLTLFERSYLKIKRIINK